MMALKLITFDLDNTLWPVDEVIRRADARCLAWIAAHHAEAAQQLTPTRLRQLRDQLLQQQPHYIHDLTALRTDMLAHGFEQAGYRPAEARRVAQQAFTVFHDARNEVSFFPGALTALEQLAEDYLLGALTNGNANLEKIGIADYFAFHHSSETVGKRKPAPVMFEAALKSAGRHAHEALHIGDHPLEDIQGARALGFHTVWANLTDQHWPDGLAPCEHHIHNLHELPERVALFDD